jgi:ubiquinol-cytochrome c reductase cytochrome b subunit
LRWLLAPLAWFEDRTGAWALVRRLALHPVPGEVTSFRRGWFYVFGIATLTAFVIQGVTGVILATIYVPSTDNAYASLQFITETATFGNLLRGMHYFGASAMVVLVTLHAARVFLTGSYKFPRELNWLSGLLLLALTLALAFTGMLLRWDQDAIGSVLIAAEQAGRTPIVGELAARAILAGETISGSTLTRFYALHVFALPGLVVAVLGIHLYLVLRHGISEPPRADAPVDTRDYRSEYRKLLERTGRPYWPFGAWREIVFSAGVVALVLVLALLIGPRTLSEPPDPTITSAEPNPTGTSSGTRPTSRCCRSPPAATRLSLHPCWLELCWSSCLF